MTALAGFWSFSDQPPGERCARILQAQTAYGRQAARSDVGPVSLGRNLYPILDEDRFDRGPFGEDPFVFVSDVRIDNRAELAEALEIATPRLLHTCDSELLFRALLKWGEVAPKKIAGEFAFALWNDAEQELLLGRDLLGFRPLHFHRADKFIAFASMPSGLHALAEIPREVDGEFMAETLALFPRTGSATHYKGIERIEPGHVMRFTRRRVASRGYWAFPTFTFDRRSSSDIEEGLRSVVEEAVRAQLRGAANGVASHLSSGLDSSIVTSTAARLIAPGKVVSFTAVPRKGFDGPLPASVIADEARLASATAQLYPNVEHVLVDSSHHSPLAELDREHFYYQEPPVNLCNAVWGRQIHRLASERGLNVLLIGNCGNSTASYAGFEALPALAMRGRLLKVIRTARLLARNGVRWRSLAAQLAGPFLPAPVWALACSLHGRPTSLREYTTVRPDLGEALARKARQRGFDLLYRPWRDPLGVRLSVLFDSDPGNYHKGVLAQWGVSVRDPFADKRVIEYCLRVPPEEYLRDGVPRSLARRAFRDRLPPEVAATKVRGYQSPDWYEAIERDLPLLQEEVEAIGRCDAASRIMDVGAMEEAVRSWPTDGWADLDILFRYRYGLLRGISAGHFMRKATGTN